MIVNKKKEDLSEKMQEGFKKTREKLVVETKKNNSYIIVSDKNGNIKKISAKDL